mgnify:CR=1 FL=1
MTISESLPTQRARSPFAPPTLEEARRHAAEVPLAEIDITHWDLFRHDIVWPYFDRLRQESPVYFHRHTRYGPLWSVTSYEHVKAIDTDHHRFSSEPTISLLNLLDPLPMFIAMDEPRHSRQRKTVSPVVSPRNLMALEPTIRRRVVAILDALPEGETFNWVEKVSIELTTQMLATLFDFPFEDRHLLTRWSDIATGGKDSGHVDTWEEAGLELQRCLDYFTRLRDERARQEPGNDLLSLMAHGDAIDDLDPSQFLGNLLLLIVGGNDTTRNSISGGVLAMNLFPEEEAKLRADPSLIPNAVAEIIRWQTPLAYMRRTAKEDVEIAGETIRAGDKVAMWYLAANRDPSVFEDPHRILVDRDNARSHISFGFGIHRCMGNRLAEMQLRVVWEEILPRFAAIEVVGDPARTKSNFVHGYTELPVVVRRR